ncbi:MAG: hypothetical protein RLZZ450_1393, partial [Pseudomonadota bacterium]
WFWEGLATYYEERLQPGIGRPAWPVWDGLFRAAVATKRLDGGDLSELNRRLHWGNHYVYGSHFIAYLVETYGEARLWKLVERQGQSFFFPFIVNQRFSKVYGKRLSLLIEEFSRAMLVRYPPRERPQTQRALRDVGMNGRYARAADGSEAVVSDAMDAPATLTVYAPDGTVRYRERLTDVAPRRNLVSPDSRSVSGLRFSRDGQHLYFVAVDPALVFQETRLMHLDLQKRDLTRVAKDIGGLGGDISPDGRSYLFVRVDATGHALATYDLVTGQVHELHRPPAGVYFSSPNYSPDGSKIAVSVFAGGYALALFDAQSGARLRTLSPTAGPVYDVSFIDDDRLLFLGAHERRFQAFSYTLSTSSLAQLTNAPYLVLQPRAAHGTVRFFNREGLRYTLDEVALPTPGAQAVNSLTFAPRLLADVGPDGGAAQLSAPPPMPSDQTLEFQGVVTATPPAPAPAVPSAVPAEVVPSEPAPVPEAGVPADAAAATGAPVPPVVTPVPSAASGLSLVEDRWLTLPPPPSLVLTQSDDEPYAVFPRLLVPSVRAPQFSAGSTGAAYLGAYLGGTDALGKHRWGASVGVQPIENLWSGSFGYINAQLSPLLLQFVGSQASFDAARAKRGDRDGDGDREQYWVHDHRRQRDLDVTASLTLRTSQLALSVHATNDQEQNPDLDEDDGDAAERVRLTKFYKNRTLSGASLGFVHYAVESTPMSGPRRGYATSLAGSYYPQSLGTLDSNVADVRGELALYAPLPFSRRHTLRLDLRARAIVSDEPQPLLELGGSPWLNLYDHPDQRTHDPYIGLAPKRRFRETLRGFETANFNVNQVGIVDLAYRYPIVIDRGTATSFSILPSFFLRQIDLELFATGASDVVKQIGTFGHLAVGGSVAIKLAWMRVLALRYQLAKRFTDADDLQHLIALGIDL